jgi:hypothetical protein
MNLNELAAEKRRSNERLPSGYIARRSTQSTVSSPATPGESTPRCIVSSEPAIVRPA